MMRAATPADAAAIEAFLARYAETSMFLRGNLQDHGVKGGTHPHATRFFVDEDGGVLSAVFGRTNHGFLMCQMPEPVPLAPLREALAGQEVIGMTGAPRQVVQCLAELGIDGPWSVARDDPLYAVALSSVQAPTLTGRAPEPGDAPMLAEWFAQYETETGLFGPAEGHAQRVQARAKAVANGEGPETLLLLRDGKPVAMSAFNARARDMVQIGGVFVPPELRGQGLGGQAVAAQLAAAQGVSRAILFAASAKAARCYEKIGFEHIGAYRVNLLPTPHRIEAAQ